MGNACRGGILSFATDSMVYTLFYGCNRDFSYYYTAKYAETAKEKQHSINIHHIVWDGSTLFNCQSSVYNDCNVAWDRSVYSGGGVYLRTREEMF